MRLILNISFPVLFFVMSNSFQKIYVSINFYMCTEYVNVLVFFLNVYLCISLEIP